VSEFQIALLITLLLLAPLLVVTGITLGVWLNMRAARFLERRDPQDVWQERVFGAEARAGALARGHGVLREGYWQSVAWASQGLHHVRPFRFPAPVPGGGLPVVLVAGYVENSSQMVSLGRRLAREGYQPVLLDLPSTFRAIEENVSWLAERVAEIRAASGYARVGYVGHSMGGVVGRVCTLRQEDPGVAVVITLASPHRGTHLADMGLGQSARDMRRASAFAKRYPPGAIGHAPIRSVIAREDNIVSPAWSAVLPHAETVLARAPLGHTGILFDAEVHELVLGWLGQVTPEPLGFPAPAPSEALSEA
jgi:pimeloyl-ACP methyl ester carboxylesterase